MLRRFHRRDGNCILTIMRTRNVAAAMTVAGVVLLCLWGPVFHNVMHDQPFGKHSWKQGDCLALAQRFLGDGNWDILDPRGQSRIPVDGKVNAELPLTAYFAAVGARAVGAWRLEEIYRLLTLLFSSLAPLSLFVYVWRRTASVAAGLLPLAFLATCPVFLYYATGFHPDPAGFGLLMLGLMLLLAERADRPAGFRTVAGIGAMTLGSLMKLSLAPYLLVPAVLALHRSRQGGDVTGVRTLLTSIPRAVRAALVGSGLLLAGELVYLNIRAVAYAPTFFTAAPHPFRSLDHLASVAGQMWNGWLPDLFTPPQLIVLGVCTLALVVWGFSGRRPDELTIASAAAALVMVGLFVLFGQQFAWHDYYAIATFYPLAGLLVVRLSLELWEIGNASRVASARPLTALVFLAIGVAMALPFGERLELRTSPWWRNQVAWLGEARGVLEGCGRRCWGQVAVLGSEPPNLALTHLNRQGYVLGLGLDGGLGVPALGSVEGAARYMRERKVRVLVVKQTLLDRLPAGDVDRWFAVAGRSPGAQVLLLRK